MKATVRNTVINLIPALLLILFLSACGSEAEPETEVEAAAHEETDAAQATSPTTATEPRMEDGVQVVDVTVGQMGYEPLQIRLEAGVPARLVFTRTVEGECPSQVQIPAFDVEKTELPMNQPVAIEFMPDEAGSFQFVCGMDMMEGALLVES